MTDRSNCSGVCWLSFFYYCITNHYKLSHLDQQPIISSQLCQKFRHNSVLGVSRLKARFGLRLRSHLQPRVFFQVVIVAAELKCLQVWHWVHGCLVNCPLGGALSPDVVCTPSHRASCLDHSRLSAVFFTSGSTLPGGYNCLVRQFRVGGNLFNLSTLGRPCDFTIWPNL